ncbi:MAG: hypothetical protein JSV77_01815 [Dehalococcoidales bacterium]|nr:MAG: hypothetical protein JSV77_01815 [Dehalococcoidales bacterium]
MPAPKRSPTVKKPIKGIGLLSLKDQLSLKAQQETHERISRKVAKTK